MNHCLQLAELGAGWVAPNPIVGAVLVYANTIIGEGYHQQYGGPHAEVNCINSVAEKNRHLISSATLYVSLEPCAHFGKTPPCADLIIKNKIPKVVVACRDLFAEVNGLGIQKMKDAGIDVVENIMEKAAIDLNKKFFYFHRYKKPYVILKWAQTADGFVARENFEALPISNPYTNRWVHKMRASEMAIMIGTNTALYDTPSLTTRHWIGKNPVRIVIDKKLQLNKEAALFSEAAATIILNELREAREGHLHYIRINKEERLLPQLLQLLFQKNIQSLIVEGGPALLQSFVDEGLWNEAFIITNEAFFLKSGVRAASLPADKFISSWHMAGDKIAYYNNLPSASETNIT
ncbi:MAG: bifunctional diaminohydroxyphosphoribosylaminopyrimidine deaminase/5-amino-6-(5-phosphoribosylamino)uracil reductase RibD [Chitinophagaceae bacterium]|nr:MAG: bifunctional diaminohydroxyphosphoribosylaminopyrimidine deaminase/5-amino-6-(5-phosphoribosylamino)uracil reductase RibD [Chitinophagaceae bacterium]